MWRFLKFTALHGGIGVAIFGAALPAYAGEYADEAYRLYGDAVSLVYGCQSATNPSQSEALLRGLEKLKISSQLPCSPDAAIGLDPVSTGIINFSRIEGRIRQDSEKGFYDLLATQYTKELACSASFAGDVSHGHPEIVDDLAAKLIAIKQNQKIANETFSALGKNVSMPKVCPNSSEELKNDQYFTPEARKICQEVIDHRSAALSIAKLFPLEATSSVTKLLDHALSLPDDPKLVRKKVREAFRQAKAELEGQRKNLIEYLNGKRLVTKKRFYRFTTLGTEVSKTDEEFGDRFRATLLSDPALVAKVIHEGGPELRGLACQGEAKYIKVPKAIDKTLMIGSLAGGAGSVARNGFTLVSRRLAQILARQATGAYSFQALDLLPLLSVGSGALAAYEKIHMDCSKQTIPQVLPVASNASEAATDSGGCVSAPNVQRIKNSNCLLTTVFSTIGIVPGSIFTRAILHGSNELMSTLSPDDADSDSEE